MNAAFTKHDSGKLRWSLVPWGAMRQLVRCLMHGAAKYGDDNWVRCSEPMRYWDAAMRHLTAWQEGEAFDKESGLNHLAHAGVSVLFLLALTGCEVDIGAERCGLCGGEGLQHRSVGTFSCYGCNGTGKPSQNDKTSKALRELTRLSEETGLYDDPME